MNKTRRKEMHYLVAVVIIFFIAMFSHTEHYGYSDHILVRAFFGFLPNFIYIGLLSAWCVSIERRIINKQIKHFLMGTGILMIFWIAVRTVKWRFFSPFDVIGRYLWYCYYIPMILVRKVRELYTAEEDEFFLYSCIYVDCSCNDKRFSSACFQIHRRN